MIAELERAAIRLHVLHHASMREVEATWLSDELASHGYDINPSGLYVVLHKMADEGLLVATRRVVDGLSRPTYRIGLIGTQTLDRARTIIAKLAIELIAGVDGGVDRLHTHPHGHLVSDEMSPESISNGRASVKPRTL